MCVVSPLFKSSTFAYITNISLTRTFRFMYDSDFTISCSAFRLDGTTSRQGHEETYHSGQISLLNWVERFIKDAVTCR